MENYFFDTGEISHEKKVFVLIIYDIVDNRTRQKLARHLEGYGFRIQKSAFEAELTEKKFDRLVEELKPYGNEDDSLRIYRISGRGSVIFIGKEAVSKIEDVLVF